MSTQESTYKKKYAFTLAEVLITLGIIGVVAAMTMPALMQNYQKKVTVNKLRKIYAELAQVIQSSEAEYGLLENWDYMNQPGTTTTEKTHYLFENYIIKRLKTTKICKGEDEFAKCNAKRTFIGLNNNNTSYGFTDSIYIITASGYGILLHQGGNTLESKYKPHLHFVVDIDGPYKGDNRFGKDIFIISLHMGKQVAFNPDGTAIYSKSGLMMFGSGTLPPRTRDELRDDTSNGCNKNALGNMCGAMIEADGWEIKDDYPW